MKSLGTEMCAEQHCAAVSEYVNKICKENGWQVNHLVQVEDPVTEIICFCSCSCLAYDSPVLQSATASKPIQMFVVDDPVLAFDADGQSRVVTIAFSNGTSATSVQPEMAYVSLRIGNETETLVATLNHPFLGEDKRLIQAQMLVPGYRLMLIDGTTAEITRLEIKSYTGGVWNIATSIGEPQNLDGHLLAIGRVLSADYAAQLYYDELAKKGFAVPRGSVPTVTTRAHDAIVDAHATRQQGVALAQRPEIDLKSFLASAGSSKAIAILSAGTGSITLQGDHSVTLQIPASAMNQGFLTQAQASEVQELQQAESTRDPQRAGNFLWLLKTFHAFYPHIHFIFDTSSRQANAFSFVLDSQPYVLVQGGLVRAQHLEWQGMALVLGYLVKRFEREAPYTLRCKAIVDYLAPSVLQTVFNPLYSKVIHDALSQVSAMFIEIPSKADEPESGCASTTLDCRLETYKKSMGFLPEPSCITPTSN